MKLLLVLMFICLLSFGHGSAQADGPQIFVTWETKGYVPAGYPGKILPVNGSHIRAMVAALSGGSFLDLSKEEIAWYVNGTPIQDAVGGQNTEFDVSTLTQSSLELKVQLLTLQGGPYFKIIEIPITRPEAVMEFRSPKDVLFGNNLLLTALPYFFTAQNISELNFSWQVNGQSPASLNNPQFLSVKSQSNFQSGSQIQVSLNISGGSQSASKNKIFTAQ